MLLITAQPIRNLRTPASADMNKRGFLEQASPPPLPNPPPLFPFLPIPYPLPPTPFDACYAGYISMEFLRSFLRRHFAGKPLVASRNVGCFLRLLRKIVEIQKFWGGKGGWGRVGVNVSLSLAFFLGTNSSTADQKTSSQLEEDMFVSALGSKTL